MDPNPGATISVSSSNLTESGLFESVSKSMHCLDGLGKDFEHLALRLSDLRERLTTEQLHLAVLGQFKRGKSSILNALLGESVLPTAAIPLTAIPTFIRPGEALTARVHFQGDRVPRDIEADTVKQLTDALARYVTEDGNPENKLLVAHVEVFHPADLVRKGIVLIDTPGFGSTLRHNTETTMNFLPQCDAALFVVSVDPPITEVEVEFLREVRSKVARLLVVVNKKDYVEKDDLEATLAFLRQVLTQQVGLPVDVPIFCVSARWGLESCRTGDRSLWRSSGLESLNRYLMDVLVRDKVSAIREVVERKTADVLGEALLQLRLSICSLRMPIEQLEQCLEMLNAKIAEARSLRMAAADMLTGDRKRLHQELEDHADVLRAQARDYLDSIVRKIVSDTHRIDEQVVQDAMAGAVPGYFEHQLRHTTQMFRNRTTQTLSTHQERANQLIESLRMAASDMFDVPYDAPGSAETLVTAQKPYWVTHTWSNTILPVPVSLIDRLMPAAIRRKRVLERLSAQVSDLVMRNVENLRWATFQSIDETFLRFSQTLDRRLADTIAATHGAVQVAMQKRQNAGQLVKADEEVLAKAVTHLELLNSQLRVTSSDSCDTV